MVQSERNNNCKLVATSREKNISVLFAWKNGRKKSDWAICVNLYIHIYIGDLTRRS